MIHGKNSVEMFISVAAKETIGRVGTKCLNAIFLEFLDSRFDNILLLRAQQSVVSGMWVQGKNGNTWIGDAEIAFQTLMEDGCLLNDGFFGNSF